MEDEGIEDGDLVVIRREQEPKKGDLVIALDGENQNTLKNMHSEMEVFQSEMRLISAGCLLTERSGLMLIPLISPEEARNWCETDSFCREECEQKLELLIVEYEEA